MWKITVLWLVSLTVVAAMASAFASAQARQAQPQTTPDIISGSDLGFRVDGTSAGRAGGPTGTLMIRVNGIWVEAAIAPKVQGRLLN